MGCFTLSVKESLWRESRQIHWVWGFGNDVQKKIKSFWGLMEEDRGVVQVKDMLLVAAMAPPGGGRHTETPPSPCWVLM